MIRTLHLDGHADADLTRAADLLRSGGLVAFPTETVYGLGADGLDAPAVARIFEAKGRPSDNPLILHVASFDAAMALWVPNPPEAQLARRLADAFWPGPLTMVLPAARLVPRLVTAGLDTVAVRVPDHDLALRLIARVGRPLAAPSANRSGRPSPTTAEHVLRTLAGRIDAVLDGGPTQVGLESTVVDLRGAGVRILREGRVTAGEIEAVAGVEVVGDAEMTAAAEGEAARAPGMRHRHYAPEGLDTHIVDLESLVARWHSDAAVLCRAATAQKLGGRRAALEALPDDPDGYARSLYAALYRLEGSGASTLLIEALPEDEGWSAVRDRIARAAAG